MDKVNKRLELMEKMKESAWNMHSLFKDKPKFAHSYLVEATTMELIIRLFKDDDYFDEVEQIYMEGRK